PPECGQSKGRSGGVSGTLTRGLGRTSIRANTLGAVNVPDGTSGAKAHAYHQRPPIQSSSASRFTAAASAFFILSQSDERKEREAGTLRCETMPSRPRLKAWAKTVEQSSSIWSLNPMPGLALATIDASVALLTSSGSRRRSSPFSSIKSKAYTSGAKAHAYHQRPLSNPPPPRASLPAHPRSSS